MVSTPKSIECIDCVIGRHQNINGQASCLPCIPGKAINVEGSVECSACPKNTFSGQTLASACLDCDVGRTTLDATGSTSCTICAAGTYGLGCKNCEVGQYRTGGDDGTSGKREQQQLIFNVRSFNILTCSSLKIFSSCLFYFFFSSCLFFFSSFHLFFFSFVLILFFFSDATTCVGCPSGYHQSSEGQASCLPCAPGLYNSENSKQVW